MANVSTVLSGKAVANHRRQALAGRIKTAAARVGRSPGLAVLLVGENPASQVYVRNKAKACESVGIHSTIHRKPAAASQDELLALIQQINADPKVDGLLVQLPLPAGLDTDALIQAVSPLKDVDCLTRENVGLFYLNQPRTQPCTPSGVMAMLEHYDVPVAGRNAVVIGRSHIVGQPMAQLLQQANATVTLCHSQTKDLAAHTKQAEILVAAAGRPEFIGPEHVAQGAIVIDVGIHRKADGKLCGDVQFAKLTDVASAISPVPGGVGPMTIQMLLENTLALFALTTG